MKIILPAPKLLSNNAYYAGMYYKKRQKIAEEWHYATFIAVRNNSDGELPTKFPVRVIYHVYMPNRRMDIDNVSTKAILDGLVLAEVLPGDSLEFVREVRTVFKDVDKIDPRIEIYIEEMEDDD
jgi:Holliday junction resolvase RusA-like endonuclease